MLPSILLPQMCTCLIRALRMLQTCDPTNVPTPTPSAAPTRIARITRSGDVRGGIIPLCLTSLCDVQSVAVVRSKLVLQGQVEGHRTGVLAGADQNNIVSAWSSFLRG